MSQCTVGSVFLLNHDKDSIVFLAQTGTTLPSACKKSLMEKNVLREYFSLLAFCGRCEQF